MARLLSLYAAFAALALSVWGGESRGVRASLGPQELFSIWRKNEKECRKAGEAGFNPPVLTGGLKPENNCGGLGYLADTSFDWLSLTVSASASRTLVNMTQFREDGRPIAGFGASESRICLGGTCWRKMQPHQSEKACGYGKNYESWEFSGPVAHSNIPKLVGLDCKPTRIDVAFDFKVDSAYTPDEWIESVRSHFENKRLNDGISGQNDINTRYIGSKQSDRRIRVYRKDIQDLVIAQCTGPCLRIELILKAAYAVAFWRILCESSDNAVRVAAAYITEMTGFVPLPDNTACLPHFEKKIPSKLPGRILNFIKQYALFFKVVQNSKIDIQALIDTKYSQAMNSKVARHRIRLLEAECASSKPKDIEAVVLYALEGNSNER
jgi:hypothetical protein